MTEMIVYMLLSVSVPQLIFKYIKFRLHLPGNFDALRGGGLQSDILWWAIRSCKYITVFSVTADWHFIRGDHQPSTCQVI